MPHMPDRRCYLQGGGGDSERGLDTVRGARSQRGSNGGASRARDMLDSPDLVGFGYTHGPWRFPWLRIGRGLEAAVSRGARRSRFKGECAPVIRFFRETCDCARARTSCTAGRSRPPPQGRPQGRSCRPWLSMVRGVGAGREERNDKYSSRKSLFSLFSPLRSDLGPRRGSWARRPPFWGGRSSPVHHPSLNWGAGGDREGTRAATGTPTPTPTPSPDPIPTAPAEEARQEGRRGAHPRCTSRVLGAGRGNEAPARLRAPGHDDGGGGTPRTPD